eukprot:576339-Prorocentrum_minimum.AAC.1
MAYVEVGAPLAMRRADLAKSYFFECACDRCAFLPNPPLAPPDRSSCSAAPHSLHTPRCI